MKKAKQDTSRKDPKYITITEHYEDSVAVLPTIDGVFNGPLRAFVAAVKQPSYLGKVFGSKPNIFDYMVPGLAQYCIDVTRGTMPVSPKKAKKRTVGRAAKKRSPNERF